MSLRLRISAAAGLAVALAVLAAAIGLYLAVRSDLRGQVDDSLNQRARIFLATPLIRSEASPSSRSGATQLPGTGALAPSRISGPLPRDVQPARYGAASGYVQFVAKDGAIVVPGGQGSTPKIKPDAREKAIAASGRGRELADRTVKGTHLRVLTIGISSSSASRSALLAGDSAHSSKGAGALGAVMIALPLTSVDSELSRILLILLIVGVCGIALAVLLGALVARTALAPIARFTRRTESLAGELNLSERLDVAGGDELARLARSFNTTLAALEAALEAQRQLIADASHELRTPIASLRANIQVLEDAERLPAAEQRRLHADIVEELDELTALVGDVVELARGAQSDAELADVRLDEIVRDAAAVARRRSELQFELDLQPTIVRGDPSRIGRAVANLLDNARKWSPPGAAVEVVLRDGLLRVLDHGPGFAAEDLPRVFERFYRSERARNQHGSGLGLAIVRQAAEAHGGFVRAANAPAGGACLEVSFGPHIALTADLESLTL